MGDIDDLKAGKAGVKMTPEQKTILFAMHYGAGANKIAAYAQQDVDAAKAIYAELYDGVKTPKAKEVGHLFLGGTLHGQRALTDGQWNIQVPVYDKPNVIGKWDEFEVPTVGYTVQNYIRQKIMLPGHNTPYAEVFILDEHGALGTGNKDKLIGQHMLDFFSPMQNSVNTPVLPPLPKPVVQEPVQKTDGLRITIGGKTIEWTVDQNQLEGLLSWAAQSLGPGKEAS